MATGASSTFNRDQATRAIRQQTQRNLEAAAIFLVNKVRQNIGRTQPIRRGSGTRRYGAFPSRPGEFPKKVTGYLQRSVTWSFKGADEVEVGTSVLYGKFLELGTARIRGRSFLRRTLEETQAEVLKILSVNLSAR